MSVIQKAINLPISILGAKPKVENVDVNKRLIVDEYGNLRVNYNNKSVQDGMSKQIKALKKMELRKVINSTIESN